MKRLIACLLFLCLVFAMTACQQPATQISTEPTTETSPAKTPLTWEVKNTRGSFMDGDSGRTRLQIMTYESTNDAVKTILEQNGMTSGTIYERNFAHWAEPSAYFEENSLFIIESGCGDMEVLDVYIEKGKLNIICANKWEGVYDSKYCYFLKVQDYKPTSEDDIIFEIRRPRA